MFSGKIKLAEQQKQAQGKREQKTGRMVRVLLKKRNCCKEKGGGEHRNQEHVPLDFVGLLIGGVACQSTGKKHSQQHPDSGQKMRQLQSAGQRQQQIQQNRKEPDAEKEGITVGKKVKPGKKGGTKQGKIGFGSCNHILLAGDEGGGKITAQTEKNGKTEQQLAVRGKR